MGLLERWAGYLAIAGGAVMVLALVIVTFDPESPAWNALFVVVALLAAAVLGLYERTKSAVGQQGVVTSLAWLVGGLGFAVALIRGRALSSVGAWLVLVGAVVGAVAGFAGGENPPPALFLVFVLFGVGWMLLGYAATREPAG